MTSFEIAFNEAVKGLKRTNRDIERDREKNGEYSTKNYTHVPDNVFGKLAIGHEQAGGLQHRWIEHQRAKWKNRLRTRKLIFFETFTNEIDLSNTSFFNYISNHIPANGEAVV